MVLGVIRYEQNIGPTNINLRGGGSKFNVVSTLYSKVENSQLLIIPAI